MGIYSHITSILAVADIPIHSFHTIGGEILILVKNEVLVKTQEVLKNSLGYILPIAIFLIFNTMPEQS